MCLDMFTKKGLCKTITQAQIMLVLYCSVPALDILSQTLLLIMTSTGVDLKHEDLL